MSRIIFPAIVIMLLAFTSDSEAAEVYKCVNASGKVTYSSQPCPQDSNSEKLQIRTRRSAGAENAAEQAEGAGGGEPGSMQELDAKIAAEDDPVLKAQLEITRQKCELATTQMQRYEDAPYLVRKEADGTQVRLTDEEAAAEKARVRQFLAEQCR